MAAAFNKVLNRDTILQHMYSKDATDCVPRDYVEYTGICQVCFCLFGAGWKLVTFLRGIETLRVRELKVLRRIFSAKGHEVTGTERSVC
jgi:hypothetical protein